MIICKDFNKSLEIESLDEWFDKCPPAKGAAQWKDGRSAKELARDWTEKNGKEDLEGILNATDIFNGVIIQEAYPEHESKFDNYGKGRQHDLLVVGNDERGELLVSIEAKADEAFGELLSQAYNQKNTSSKKPPRIDDLSENLLGVRYNDTLANLRYQLLHGIARTLSAAKERNIERCVFLVTTYKSEDKDTFNQNKHMNNQKDLDVFVDKLTMGKHKTLSVGDIIGPLKFGKADFIDDRTELYIMKHSVNI